MIRTSTLKVIVDPKSAVDGAKKIKAAVSGMSDSAVSKISKVHKAFTKLSAVAKVVSHAITGFYGTLVNVSAISAFLREMIKVNNMFTSFISTMHVVTKSVKLAKAEWVYLTSVANRLGVQISGLAEPYARLAASLKGVDTQGRITKHMFEAISMASVVLHKSAFDTNLMFKAIEQAASKGRIQLEELQKQLSQQLPGAMRLAAVGWYKMKHGMSAASKETVNAAEALASFYIAVSNGTAGVSDTLVGLGNEIKLQYVGSVEYAQRQFVAATAKMKNEILLFFKAVGQNGAMKGLTDVLTAVREKIASLSDGAASLGSMLGDAFGSIADYISNIKMQDVIDMFVSLKAVVHGAILAFGDIATSLANIASPMGTLKGTTESLGPAFYALSVGIYKTSLTIIAAAQSVVSVGLGADFLYEAVKRFFYIMHHGWAYSSDAAEKAANRFDKFTSLQARTINEVLKGSTDIEGAWAKIQRAAEKSAKAMKEAGKPLEVPADMSGISPDQLKSIKGNLGSTSILTKANQGKLLSEAKSLGLQLVKLKSKYTELSSATATVTSSTDKLKAKIAELRSTDSVANGLLADKLEILLQVTRAIDDQQNSINALIAAKRISSNLDKLDARSKPSGRFHVVSDVRQAVTTGKARMLPDGGKSKLLGRAQGIEDAQRVAFLTKTTDKMSQLTEGIKIKTSAETQSAEAVAKANALATIHAALVEAETGASDKLRSQLEAQAATMSGKVSAAYDKLIEKKNTLKGDQYATDSSAVQQSAGASNNQSLVDLGQMSQFDAMRSNANSDFGSATSAEDARFAALSESQQKRQDLKKQHLDTMAALETAHKNRIAAIDKGQSKDRVQAMSSMFGDLSTLMNSHSRKAFEVGKAAATAQAVIDTIGSAQKAFNSLVGVPIVGPALGAAAAGAALVAGYMRVQKIQSTQFGSAGAGGGGGGGGASSGGAASAPRVQQPTTFNPRYVQQPNQFSPNKSNQGVTIVQHINAPGATVGTAQVVQQAAAQGAQQAIATVANDFQTNGPLRQQLAV